MQTSGHSLTQRGRLSKESGESARRLPKGLSETSEEASTSLLQTTKIFLKGSGLKIKQTKQKEADGLWPSHNKDTVGNNMATFRHFKRGLIKTTTSIVTCRHTKRTYTSSGENTGNRYTQPRVACNQGLS